MRGQLPRILEKECPVNKATLFDLVDNWELVYKNSQPSEQSRHPSRAYDSSEDGPGLKEQQLQPPRLETEVLSNPESIQIESYLWLRLLGSCEHRSVAFISEVRGQIVQGQDDFY